MYILKFINNKLQNVYNNDTNIYFPGKPKNVQTVNITTNPYHDRKIYEEWKLTKMINESLKNISKILDNSSKDYKNEVKIERMNRKWTNKTGYRAKIPKHSISRHKTDFVVKKNK